MSPTEATSESQKINPRILKTRCFSPKPKYNTQARCPARSARRAEKHALVSWMEVVKRERKKGEREEGEKKDHEHFSLSSSLPFGYATCIVF